jgi:hypothetical protein
VVVCVKLNDTYRADKGRGEFMREFTRFCRKNGIHPEPVTHRNPDGPGNVPMLDERGDPVAWECTLPNTEAYRRLADHPVVRECWLPVSVAIPRGMGTTNPDPDKPIPKDISATVAKNIRQAMRSVSGEGSDLRTKPLRTQRHELPALWAEQQKDAKRFEKESFWAVAVWHAELALASNPPEGFAKLSEDEQDSFMAEVATHILKKFRAEGKWSIELPPQD